MKDLAKPEQAGDKKDYFLIKSVYSGILFLNMSCPWGLGVTSFNRQILLLRRSPLEKKKNTFQVAISKNGFDFTNFKKWAEIIEGKGQQEKVKDCQDFRISKTEKSYFLTYKLRKGKSYRLCGAFWGGFSHWQKTGEVADIKEAGMVVPRYRHQGKYTLYFGEKAIKIARSADLINWQVLAKPVFTLPKNLLAKGFCLKIATIIPEKSGILLVYFLYRNNQAPTDHSLKTIVFDKDNPGEILEESDRPILRLKETNKVSYPLGAVKLKKQLIAYWQTEKGEILAFFCPSLKKSRFSLLLRRFIENPILKPLKEHFWESRAVFNTAAFYDKKKVHFIYRAVGDNDVSTWGYASSKNGFHIDERLKEPIFTPSQFFKKGEVGLQRPGLPFYLSGGGGLGGCEDPRITKVKDRLYITYTAFDGFNSPRVALTSIKTDDFLNKRWNWQKPVLISPPGEIHKNWVVFPEKINGKYAILHSLSPNILIDYFDNLSFNGTAFIKSYHDGSSNGALWEERVRGAGPPPIKTKDGWLIFYHAMDKQDSGHYKMGAMILDYEKPTKILYRCRRPILEPSESYENQGLKPGIVYSCGATVINQQLFLYYGGADTVVCLANASLNRFLNELKSTGMPKSTFRFKSVAYDN